MSVYSVAPYYNNYSGAKTIGKPIRVFFKSLPNGINSNFSSPPSLTWPSFTYIVFGDTFLCMIFKECKYRNAWRVSAIINKIKSSEKHST